MISVHERDGWDYKYLVEFEKEITKNLKKHPHILEYDFLLKNKNGIAYILEFYDTKDRYLFTKVGCTQDIKQRLIQYRTDKIYQNLKVIVRAIFNVKEAPEFRYILESLLHYYFANEKFLNCKWIPVDKFIYKPIVYKYQFKNLKSFFNAWADQYLKNIVLFHDKNPFWIKPSNATKEW